MSRIYTSADQLIGSTPLLEVKNIEAEFIDSKTFEMIIKTEGGLYIKELISSDEGRSNPSVTEVLGTQAICAELDVIEVGIK